MPRKTRQLLLSGPPTLPRSLRSPEDAEAFVLTMVGYLGAGYNPDTDAHHYVSAKTGEQLFSADYADQFNLLTQQLFAFNEIDPYSVAVDAIEQLLNAKPEGVYRPGTRVDVWAAAEQRFVEATVIADHGDRDIEIRIVGSVPVGWPRTGLVHSNIVRPYDVVNHEPRRSQRRVLQKQQAFDVYLHGKEIDTVFWTGESSDEVRRSLIEHDGFDPAIVVRQRS